MLFNVNVDGRVDVTAAYIYRGNPSSIWNDDTFSLVVGNTLGANLENILTINSTREEFFLS